MGGMLDLIKLQSDFGLYDLVSTLLSMCYMTSVVIFFFYTISSLRKGRINLIVSSVIAAIMLVCGGVFGSEIPAIGFALSSILLIQYNFDGTVLTKIFQIFYFLLLFLGADFFSFFFFTEFGRLLFAPAIVFLFTVVIRISRKKIISKVNRGMSILLLAILALNIVIMVLNMKVVHDVNSWSRWVSIVIFILLLMLLYAFDYLVIQEQKKSDIALYEASYQEKKQQLESEKSYLEERRKHIHDIKNHLVIIKKAVDDCKYEYAKSYIDEVKSLIQNEGGGQNNEYFYRR